MVEKIKNTNFILAFKIIYLLQVFMAFNCFTFSSKYLSVSSLIVILTGVALLCWRLVRYKEYIYCKYLGILFLFMVSYAITMIANYKYGIWGNIKGGIWMTFQFFLLYCISEKDDIVKIKHEFKIMLGCLISYTTLCSFAGIFMLIKQFGGRFNFEDGTGSFYGFIWGRLWGCYTDPNHGAIITAAAVLAALYLLFEVKKVYQKVIICGTAVLNYLYIVFSDSRSTKISLTLAVFVILVFLMIMQFRSIEKKDSIFRGIIVILITVLFYFSFGEVKNGYNYYVQKSVEKQIEAEELNEDNPKIEESDEDSLTTEEKADIEKEKVESLTVGREEDIKQDFSNRRFDIWKSGIQIFNENKLLGISFRNISSYANREMPDIYIVNNDYGDFDSFHNVVVDVLVSQGILGIVIIVIMGIVFLVYCFKKLVLEKLCCVREIRILFALMILLLADSMFISEIFYVNSPETVLFWMFLGYLMYFIKKNEKNGETIKHV